jgi:transcriptional regulator with XRE-family HTH domain
MPNSQSPVISQKTKVLIEKLLLGKLSLAEIARVTGISEQWLENYLKARYELVS